MNYVAFAEPTGHTVNQTFYLEVLRRLRSNVRQNRPDLGQSGDWFIHHDNAAAHTAISVRQFLAKNGRVPLSRKKTREELSDISKEDFKKCFEQWKYRWNKCISCSG
ncbi:unnamed protein product [Acanthoscelides obtectus]|uniref:Transposase n=1 Tax=Acanthoscelides obtectus TaxID=200917 RepID=A0A9P0PJR6_ACAOB|nr:unnamed protein product [Acanthoscelides obtectus]CAK1630576.1 hypothetical protein AOBTE_LOCUS6419 [Acanthoscelides obtectus]